MWINEGDIVPNQSDSLLQSPTQMTGYFFCLDFSEAFETVM